MVQINEEQLLTIRQRIVAGGVSDEGLLEDLLDHYCCFIEDAAAAGADFETAYQNAFEAITPNGTQEIQNELYFMLHLKNQTIMKRFIYGSSFLSTFWVGIAIMFKIMHWPGAEVIMFTGFIFFSLTAIILFINSTRHMKLHSVGYNFRAITGFIATLFITIGAMLKVFHLPTADVDMVIGIALFNFVFMPVFFYHLYKKGMVGTALKTEGQGA
jgi:hypothetical protein